MWSSRLLCETLSQYSVEEGNKHLTTRPCLPQDLDSNADSNQCCGLGWAVFNKSFFGGLVLRSPETHGIWRLLKEARLGGGFEARGSRVQPQRPTLKMSPCAPRFPATVAAQMHHRGRSLQDCRNPLETAVRLNKTPQHSLTQAQAVISQPPEQTDTEKKKKGQNNTMWFV